MKSENTLTTVIDEEILNASNQSQIAPAWVANAAYNQLDPEGISPTRVKYAALMALKQIARQRLRGKFETPNVNAENQHKLFPDLQQRYPIAHDAEGEPIYVQLEMLSAGDVAWNVNRMRKEASSKLKHATALETWAIERGMNLNDDNLDDEMAA